MNSFRVIVLMLGLGLAVVARAEFCGFYHGSIGEKKVFVYFYNHAAYGEYFYQQHKKSLKLVPNRKSGTSLFLHEKYQSKTTGHWMLQRQGKQWAGLWLPKSLNASDDASPQKILLSRIDPVNLFGNDKLWYSRKNRMSKCSIYRRTFNRIFHALTSDEKLIRGKHFAVANLKLQYLSVPGFRIRYPRLNDYSNVEVGGRINTVLGLLQRSDVYRARRCRKRAGAEKKYAYYDVQTKADFILDQYLLVTVNRSWFCGGRDSRQNTTHLTFNLTTGNQIDFNRFFRAGTFFNYPNNVLRSLALKKFDEGKNDPLCKRLYRRSLFYQLALNRHGVKLIFQVPDSERSCDHEFVIPFKQLRAHITPQYQFN